MKSERPFTLKYVRIRKLAAQADAPRGPGDPGNYPYGQACDSHSLPVDYCAEGWLLGTPALGRPVRVLRVRRNGVAAVGCFGTTVVTEILGRHHFGTANSIYVWEEIPPPGPC